MADAVTQIFEVRGMHCASCGMLVDDVVEDLDGVRRSQTTLRSRQAKIEFDPDRCTPDAIVAAIAEAGYQAQPQPGPQP